MHKGDEAEANNWEKIQLTVHAAEQAQHPRKWEKNCLCYQLFICCVEFAVLS